MEKRNKLNNRPTFIVGEIEDEVELSLNYLKR